MSGDFCPHWRLFSLVSPLILSVIVSISISVFTVVSVLSFGRELVDTFIHC